MFLKLPKLFNFHILRLAAGARDKQRRRQTGVEKIFSRVLVGRRAVMSAGTGTETGRGGRTFSLPSCCVTFLVHALLPPVLLPVAHGGGMA